MKRIQQILALAALAALFAFLPARADYNIQDKGTYRINANSGQVVDVSGNAKTVDADRDRDANFVYSGIISNNSLAVGVADSSTILDVHNMRLGTLLFKVSPAGGVNTKCRLAVQVRIHLNGGNDSLTTFAVYNYVQGPAQATAVNIDTTLAGHIFTGSATVPWSGENVIVFDSIRNSPLDLAAVLGVFTYPNGVAIPLSSFTGRDFYADYISIRVRNITPTGPACKVVVSLIGSPN